MKGVPLRFVEEAYRTSLRAGACAHNAVVPRLVRDFVDREMTILDFGSGRRAHYTAQFKGLGYDCTAYEFEEFADPKIHDVNALSRKYDVVMLSNVLNVQGTTTMLLGTLRQVRDSMHQHSVLFANYPVSPRKLRTAKHPDGMPAGRVAGMMTRVFGQKPEVVHGTASAPVWCVRRGGSNGQD